MIPAPEALAVEGSLSATGTPSVAREERRRHSESLLWRIVSPLFTLGQLNVLCWVLFAGFLVLPTGMALKSRIDGQHFLQQIPENDFIYFYAMGRMFNQAPAADLY